ncbi:hydrogenase 4 subunit F [Plastoroseomonas arctica]|uniref:Hydrogenase 4 subunit F n=1 Tax=Plastoroseomonas arctica TaxID=1509237 RepID=A0AAF1K1U8_9PROT|nr:hydrogenase 4 subunit F [Plastoroseomonas arctica]MBR0655323.1 hydrogenase 4 subunit F [Plastoroseomonas arctica]
MPLPWAIVFFPWLGALVLAAIPNGRLAARVNIGVSAVSLVLALTAFGEPAGLSGWTHLDALNLPLLAVGFVVGLTTAVYSAATLDAEGLDALGARAYHAAFQIFMGAQALALLADNLGVMWVAIEIATIATVLMVAIHRTPAAIEAAWKFFILCGVGIALALFGTILLYVAAQPVLGEAGLSWQALNGAAAQMDAGLLNLAFVFLLVGYGTKSGLVPLHSWLPDAHAEGPTAISAVLSGLLLNAAMHAVLRGKSIIGGNPDTLATGPFMIALGLASALLASLALWRRADARRLFAWSSIEHMGLAALAFGIGGAATLAGLLHMLGHSLIKSAIFFGVGQASILKGSQKMAAIGGLIASHPGLGWGLALAIAGIAGLPPFLLFVSEFGLVAEAMATNPWLALPLGIALLTAAAALVSALQSLCLGAPTPDVQGARTTVAATLPLWLHLGLAVWLALAMPAFLASLLRDAAGLIR